MPEADEIADVFSAASRPFGKEDAGIALQVVT